MPLFTIDSEKCKKDGFCVAECPMGIIEMVDEEALPSPTRAAADLCINCGHCVAVCPHGALSLETMSTDECPPVRKEWLLSAEQAEHFLRSRRSIRSYKERPVERQLLEKLIDIARYAPSGHNMQPVEWLVIHDTAHVKSLTAMVVDWMRHVMEHQPDLAARLHMDRVVGAWEAGHDGICRNAPHLIAAHAHKDERTAPASCTIALTYLELAAAPLGLGACWAGYFNAAANMWPPLLEALSLPKDHITFGMMMVGYSKFQYHRLPLRNKPRITWV